jgi:hypothetical protein
MMLRSLLTAALLTAAAAAQPPGQEGQLIPAPFASYAVTGPRAKFIHDLFDEHDLDPTVAVIAAKLPEKPTEPLSVLLQKLELKATENKTAHFGAFAIFLTLEKPISDDPTGGAAVGQAESLAKDLKLKEVVLGLEFAGNAPLEAFGIKKDTDEVTVLVYNQHKVVKRYTYTKDKPLSDAAVNEILAEADKLLPPKKTK